MVQGKQEQAVKVISYSLWGNDQKYIKGAFKNVDLASFFYPEWKCLFYCDIETVPTHVVDKLSSKKNSMVVKIEQSKERDHGMFWRFYALECPEVELFMSRDCDSRITEREKISVTEWISSGKSFHVMRDHPHHSTPIMGGMWGARGEKLRNIKELIGQYYGSGKWKNPTYGVDQDFLRDFVWPIAKNDCHENDEFFAKKPFTIPRDARNFIGQVYDENESPMY